MNLFGIYLGLSVLLIVFLAMNISRLRMTEKVANGDGGNKRIIKAVRAHMNSLEHILPFTLLLYFLYTHSISSVVFSVLAFGFLAVRFVHSYSMLGSKFRLRQVTAMLTYSFELIACIFVLIKSVT